MIVVDCADGLTEQDVRIAGYVHEQGKPSIIVMNKWDTIEKDDKTINKFNEKLSEDLKFMSYFTPLYVSALNGQRVNKIMETVEKVYENTNRRIGTSVLNNILSEAVLTNEPPMKSGKRCKIYYITQASVAPPTFVFFVNDKNLIHFSYERYLENCIRKAVDFSGTPIKIIIKSKGEKE